MATCLPDLDHIPRKSRTMCRVRAEFGRNRAALGRNRPELAENWPDLPNLKPIGDALKPKVAPCQSRRTRPPGRLRRIRGRPAPTAWAATRVSACVGVCSLCLHLNVPGGGRMRAHVKGHLAMGCRSACFAPISRHVAAGRRRVRCPRAVARRARHPLGAVCTSPRL